MRVHSVCILGKVLWSQLIYAADMLSADDNFGTKLLALGHFFYSLIYGNFFFRFRVGGTKKKKIKKL